MTGFVSAIERLSQNPALCARMGLSGREFILQNLTKEVGTAKYVEVIKSLSPALPQGKGTMIDE